MAEAKIVTNTQFFLSSRAQFEDFLKTQTRYKEKEEERIRQEQYQKEYLLQKEREQKEREERIRIYEEKKAEEERIKLEKKAEEERIALELRENALLKYHAAVQDEISKYDFYKGIGERYKRTGLEVRRSRNYREYDWTKLTMSFWVQTDEGVISNEEGVELTIHVRSFNIDFKDEELRDLTITCARSDDTQIGAKEGTDHMRFTANENCFTFQDNKEWRLFIDKFRVIDWVTEYVAKKIPDDAYDIELFVDGITTNSIEPYEFECRTYEKDLKISETLPIIKNCNLYIGNDTGWLHISSALGIKCLALFMDSPVQAYGKYSKNINVIVPEGETEESTTSSEEEDSIDSSETINLQELVKNELRK